VWSSDRLETASHANSVKAPKPLRSPDTDRKKSRLLAPRPASRSEGQPASRQNEPAKAHSGPQLGEWRERFNRSRPWACLYPQQSTRAPYIEPASFIGSPRSVVNPHARYEPCRWCGDSAAQPSLAASPASRILNLWYRFDWEICDLLIVVQGSGHSLAALLNEYPRQG